MDIFGIKKKHAIEVLKELEKELSIVEETRDPLDQIVKLFAVVSPVSDELGEIKEAIKPRNADAKVAFNDLVVHLEQTGRNKYGMNRTEKDQAVTGDNVYLGGTHELFTKSVNDWKNILKNEDANTQQIIYGQAQGFVNSHLHAIRKDIGQVINR